MKRAFNRTISLILAAAMTFTSVDLSAFAAQPDVISAQKAEEAAVEEKAEEELKDKLKEAADETKYPGGVFGFYETILNAAEGDELTISVVRQGSTDKEASVVFKAVDVSTEYQKDYTLSVESNSLIGDKELPAAEGVRPLLEEYGEAATEEDLEASMETEIEDENGDSNETFSGTSSLANMYSAKTGEAAPEYDWTEYNEETAPVDTVEAMQSGWDESKENLQALPGVTAYLTFAPGEYKKNIKVKVKDDSRSESDEVMIYVLQEAEGAEIGDSYSGYLNISDNDSHEELTYSIKEKELTITPDQDTAVVTVVRHSGIDQMDFITVGTQGIDAQPDVDYVKTYKELFFAAGITERTVEVPIISDRDYETHFWIGLRSTSGTVLKDNACCVTIAEDPERETVYTAVTEDPSTSLRSAQNDSEGFAQNDSEAIALADGSSADASDDAAETVTDSVEALNADDGIYEEVVFTNTDDWNKATICGSQGWVGFMDNIDLSVLDYVKVEYGLRGYDDRWYGSDREKMCKVGLYSYTNGTQLIKEIWHYYESPSGDLRGRSEYYTDYLKRDDNESWSDYKNAVLCIYCQGEDMPSRLVYVDIQKVTLGYKRYNFKISQQYNNMNQYEEKVYTGKDTYGMGSTVKYQDVYFTDGSGNAVDRMNFTSGERVSVSLAAQGEKPTSQGVYANSSTVDFKGFKLVKPSELSNPLSEDILPPDFYIDNNFSIKYKDYIYKDGKNSIELVPIFEPKKVTLTFDNGEATVNGKADAKGNFQGFASGSTQELTMLDTLDVKAVAGQGYGITSMDLKKPSGALGTSEKNRYNAYVTVSDNLKQDSNLRFVTALNYSGTGWNAAKDKKINDLTDLKVGLHFDEASIILAPDPQSDKATLKDRGKILYADHVVKQGDKEVAKEVTGGEELKIDKVSINRPYTFGSITREEKNYHTFWFDGTLDRDGDGVVNDTHPTYKSFTPSIGQSIKYVTQLPISKIYYTFLETIDSELKPLPIRGWLILHDKLLISGTESKRGLKGISVYCDGVETETKNGSYEGHSGDGYFELVSDDYYKIYNYAVTFNGTSNIGDIAAMVTMNPGINQEIDINAWDDVNISNVTLYQKEKKKNKNGEEEWKYCAIDTSGTKKGYYEGLTDGDYNYRITMTARRDGVRITNGELTFYNKDGSSVVIPGTEDQNKSGIYTFDFNPKTNSIKAGAIAMVTFYAGETKFLSRDVGIKLRASLGALQVVNFLVGGDASTARIDIIGAVNSAIDMGWKGDFDGISVTGDIYMDEDQNKVVKVGIGKNIVDRSSKDAMKEAAADAANAAKAVGKANSKVAKLEAKLGKAKDEEKEKIKEELKEAQETLKKKENDAKTAKGEFDKKLEDAKKPKKKTPKFGNSFQMDLGFSFLMTFGYDDDKASWYFKNMMLTASVEAQFKVTMNYATPIGITIGIVLTLGLDGSATFVVEQRQGFETDEKYRYYLTEKNKDDLNVLDFDGDDPDRHFENRGLFSINPTIGLDVSAGVCGDLLKVTVGGTAKFNMVFGTKTDSAGSCTLTASIKIKALIFEFSKELASKKFELWGDQDILNNGGMDAVYANAVMNALADTGNSYLFEDLDTFKTEDISYMETPSEWYGAEGLFDEDAPVAVGSDGTLIENLGAIDEGGTSAYRESSLANRIGPDADFAMVPLGNGRFAAVFINVPSDRISDPDNARAVYYTLYDQGSWSDPVLVEDDGTLDQYPRICSLGDRGALILWSTVNEKYKNTQDKLERQNALDIHGRFINADGTLKDGIEEFTMTTEDKTGAGTSLDFSDFAADKAFGVFVSQNTLVVCYEKRQYAASGNGSGDPETGDDAVVADMIYPVSTLMAARVYDMDTFSFPGFKETLETMPGLQALGTNLALDRVEAYNASVYGQVFTPYLPKVMLHEDIDVNTGYYREGGSGTTAVPLEKQESALLLESDASTITVAGKDYGVLAYTLDTDGDMVTVDDRELYLTVYDVEKNEFEQQIILTGQEINSDTGESDKPENSNPRFIATDNGLYLSWLRDPDIVAVNVTDLLENESALVKEGNCEETVYRYLDKSLPTEGSSVFYLPPDRLVTGRIAEKVEGSEDNIRGNIHSFEVSTDGRYIYIVWPESADDVNKADESVLTNTQMWCARCEASGENGYHWIENITKPVQITSLMNNNYDDVAFEVTSDAKLIGLTRKVPSRLISTSEAEEIFKENFDRDTFEPYPIWDDANAYPVSFRVDPSSVARIRNAGFLSANVSEGAAFSFEVLNDGFETLTGATVSATDAAGRSLLYEDKNTDDPVAEATPVSSLTVPDLAGGDKTTFSGHMELDKDADKAEIIITLTDSNGRSYSTTITQELNPDVDMYDMSVESTGARGLYRVRGTMKNTGTATSDKGGVIFISRKDNVDREISIMDYPELMPGETYDIDAYITVSDEDFIAKSIMVDMATGEIIPDDATDLGDKEIGIMFREELPLYVKYYNNSGETVIPVYEPDNGLDDEEDEDTPGEFITRIAYPSEVDRIMSVTGVNVSAVKAVTDENGEITGKTVSEGSGMITLEAGENVGILTDIITDNAEEITALTDSGEVKVASSGAEGLTYRYEFIGDAAAVDEDGSLNAVKPGSGKLKVYVYPSERSYSTDNYVSTDGDTTGSDYAFTLLGNGDHEDAFSEYPAGAIKTFMLDVDVVSSGGRISDIAKAYFEDNNGVRYRIVGASEVAVCGLGDGKKVTKLTIPATVKNEGTTYKVTRIDANAFMGNKDITSATIGANVMVINNNAFSDCIALKKVSFGKAVETIGENAFKGCISLTGTKLPAKLINLEKSAFEDCMSITGVTLPATLESLGDKAFYGCISLKNITIKSEKLDKESMGKDVFTGVSEKANYKFAVKSNASKDTLSSIVTQDTEIFSDKKGIRYKVESTSARVVTVVGLTAEAAAKRKSISIPANVKYKGNKFMVVRIEDGAFEGNGILTKVTLPKSVISVGDRAFADMSALKSAVIPKTIMVLGDEAYSGDDHLKKVTISSTDVSIGTDAFERVPDTAVFKINIKDAAAKKRITDRLAGNTETFIDKNDLRYEIYSLNAAKVMLIGSTKPLKTLSVPATVAYRGVKFDVTTIETFAFRNENVLKTVKLGKNVGAIGPDAFEGCKALTQVSGKYVNIIGEEAFKDCAALKSVTFGKSLLSIGDNAFAGCTNLKKVPEVKAAK